jgi:hypothetical protein
MAAVTVDTWPQPLNNVEIASLMLDIANIISPRLCGGFFRTATTDNLIVPRKPPAEPGAVCIPDLTISSDT